MSPVSSIYDHLTFNIPQQASNSNSNADNLHDVVKRKIHPRQGQEHLQRRYTITNLSIPSNQSIMKKSITTEHLSQTPSTSMDFRPLITQGRRKFGTMPSSSSMIIVKKKSPPPTRLNRYCSNQVHRQSVINLYDRFYLFRNSSFNRFQ